MVINWHFVKLTKINPEICFCVLCMQILQKTSKGSVQINWSEFPMCYGIRWFQCKIKLPNHHKKLFLVGMGRPNMVTTLVFSTKSSALVLIRSRTSPTNRPSKEYIITWEFLKTYMYTLLSVFGVWLCYKTVFGPGKIRYIVLRYGFCHNLIILFDSVNFR